MWLMLLFSLSAGRESRAQIAPIPASQPPHDVATQILHQALLQSVWGKPCHCSVRQSILLFEREMQGVGEFVRGGKGSGKLKLLLRFPGGNRLNTLLQVSDGQRMLTIERIGDQARRVEVDLEKIRPRLVLTRQSLDDPVTAMYLAIGGQAEVLRKVCQHYRWTQVREGRLGSLEVWWLDGQLRRQPAPVRGLAEVDGLNQTGQGQLQPTHVRVAVARDQAELPFWLYQVEHYRYTAAAEGAEPELTMRVVTEWADPTPLDPLVLADGLFLAPAGDEPWQEETTRYLPPPLDLARQQSGATAR